MIPSSFEYHRPASLDEAVSLLQEHGDDASLLAGGHSLLPAMKLRLSAPEHLVDIGRIEELREIRSEGGEVVIGAGATHRDVEASGAVAGGAPLLAQAAAVIGDVQVRNAGTIGGSLAHADPAADYPAAVLASEGSVEVTGPDGARSIAAADFFVELFATALQPGEIITAVRVPAPGAGTGTSYLKFPHPASRFAVCGCAAAVTVSGGACSRARVAFNGIASAAFRDAGVEAALSGASLDEESVRSAVATAAEGQELLADSFAGEDYRRQLARVYARRAVLAAAAAAA
jgi:carbon-monoxide dehydrogenase medium subunit